MLNTSNRITCLHRNKENVFVSRYCCVDNLYIWLPSSCQIRTGMPFPLSGATFHKKHKSKWIFRGEHFCFKHIIGEVFKKKCTFIHMYTYIRQKEKGIIYIMNDLAIRKNVHYSIYIKFFANIICIILGSRQTAAGNSFLLQVKRTFIR